MTAGGRWEDGLLAESDPRAGESSGAGLAELSGGPVSTGPVSTGPVSTGPVSTGPMVAGSMAAGPAQGQAGGYGPPAGAFGDAEHPMVAANRYRELMGTSDAMAAQLAERLSARQESVDVVARRHRAAAEDIRSRVATVWSQVGGALAPHGLDGLDQLRPRDGGEPDVEAVYQRYAGDLDGLHRGRVGRSAVALPGETGRGGKRAGGAGADLPEPGSGRKVLGRQGSDAGRGGRAAAGPRGRDTRRRAPVPGGGLVGPDGLVDPERAKKLAYRLCLEVMTRSAELRAVSRGGTSLSGGIVTALACALAAALTVAARVFMEAPALPCLAAAGGLGAVAVVAGGESSATAAVRSGLLAAAGASAAVLATFRFVPIEPAGTIGSLACLALALRFGLGFGAASDSSRSAGQGGAGRR
ncbi:hypothetical protein [Parafrankia elaeagni]|uniref:hypothetical protein n=1 Tax=Parafrankia elaeagni TaxID=222534 RepID=UPI00036CFE63|nr:hypothetical protein [Parafrankia elaeagni]